MIPVKLHLPFLLATAIAAAVMGQDVLTKAEKQDSSAVVPYLGIKAGVNLADQWGPDVPTNRSVALGVNGGVAVPLEFSPWFMLEPGVQYSMKGTQWDTVETAHENLTYSRTIHYLDIPLLAKFSLPLTGLVKPYLFLGASGSIRLAASEGMWGEGIRRIPHDISDSVSLVDASVLGGAAAHVFVGKGYLMLEGCFSLGLWDVDRTGKTIHNWTVGISVGYMWKLKKEKKLW